MEPILVPAPPRSAYNPNRRVSDLLLSQVKHFQHVELKRGDLGIDPAVARNIYTEGGAAQYIAAVTNALRGKSQVARTPRLAVVSSQKPAKKAPMEGLALAAAAAVPDEANKGAPPSQAIKKRVPNKAARKAVKRKS